MKVGVISDTHDRLPTFRRAITLFKRMKAEAVFHAGDYVAPFSAELLAPQELPMRLHCVYGNNGGECAGLKAVLPNVVEGPLRVKRGGRAIIMHHSIEALQPSEKAHADVLIVGHTHEAINESRNGMLLLNPGECCRRVTVRCAFALLDLDTLKAETIEVHPS